MGTIKFIFSRNKTRSSSSPLPALVVATANEWMNELLVPILDSCLSLLWALSSFI
jgi:hypothetical protein